MILYHGSNVIVQNPVVSKGKASVDFGQAFYLTSDYEQANRWANQVKNRRGTGTAYISEYEVDETEFTKLRILHFTEPNAEWLHFVADNRRRIYLQRKEIQVCAVSLLCAGSILDRNLSGCLCFKDY